MRDLFRDPDVMRDVLRRRLLRGACSAVSFLTAATRGDAGDVSDEQLRAASVLARIAPHLVGQQQEEQATSFFESAEFWEFERMIAHEALSGDDATREDFARWYATCFEKNGPHLPYFTTLAEAREYGRRRFDLRERDPDGAERHVPSMLQDIYEGEVIK